jgi:hypothetical protein
MLMIIFSEILQFMIILNICQGNVFVKYEKHTFSFASKIKRPVDAVAGSCRRFVAPTNLSLSRSLRPCRQFFAGGRQGLCL